MQTVTRAGDELKCLLRKEASAGVSLTSDVWTSRATEAYTTTTCHFLDSLWQIKSFVHFVGSHTGVRIANLSRDTVKEFDLPSGAVFAHVHDQTANAELSGKLLFESDNWRTEVCVCHRLQNCLKHAVEDIPALGKLLAKCRKVPGHFKHSALATIPSSKSSLL